MKNVYVIEQAVVWVNNEELGRKPEFDVLWATDDYEEALKDLKIARNKEAKEREDRRGPKGLNYRIYYKISQITLYEKKRAAK